MDLITNKSTYFENLYHCGEWQFQAKYNKNNVKSARTQQNWHL